MLLISQYASRMKVVVLVTYVYFGINVERDSKSLIERKSISKHSTCPWTCGFRISLLGQYVFIGLSRFR